METQENISALVKQLKREADMHPVRNCSEAPHPRHTAEFGDGTRICFTRNVRPENERYVLSVRGAAKPPAHARIEPLLNALFGKGLTVIEMGDIETPNTRCFYRVI